MALFNQHWWLYWHAGGIDWAWFAADQPGPDRAGRCELIADVPAPAGATIVLCVAGELIRMHHVAIPARSRKHLMAALPYALEDRLLHGTDTYHIVPMPKRGRQTVTQAALIDHAQMRVWQETARARDWQLQCLYPDYLALPVPEAGTWFVDAGGDPCLLRRPDGSGAALPEGSATRPPGALLLALEQSLQRPERLRIRVADRNQAESIGAWRAMLTLLDIDLEVIQDARTRAARLARQPVPRTAGAFLSGPYQTQVDGARGRGRWRPAAALAAALVMVLGLGWIIDTARIGREYRQLQQAVEAAYRDAFPDAVNVVDPRFQLEQRLNELRVENARSAADAGLLQLLEGVVPLLASAGLDVGGFEFDGTELVLDVSADTADSIDGAAGFRNASVRVSVDALEQRSDRVVAKLRVRGPS